MTEDEKKAHEIIDFVSVHAERIQEVQALVDLAERLLKENSELRVRDSNVTMHSLNVMAVNEDLQAKVKKLETLCKEWDEGDGYDSYTSFEAADAVREILGGK